LDTKTSSWQENFVETADDDHTILVGAPIVLNPPTKAADSLVESSIRGCYPLIKWVEV
jgi:hypothetical protein